MEIRGKKLELKRGKGVLNKVSVSTVTTGVEPAIRTPVAMGAGAGAGASVAGVEVSISRVGVGAVPEEVPRVRVIESGAPEAPEEFMEEGLTSPW